MNNEPENRPRIFLSIFMSAKIVVSCEISLLSFNGRYRRRHGEFLEAVDIHSWIETILSRRA